MEENTDRLRTQCILSFESSIRNTEKAFAHMSTNNQKTTLVEKRLSALKIGLAALKQVWFQQPFEYSFDEIRTSQEMLNALLPSMKKLYRTSKEGSSQRTLLERRILALELAINAMKEIPSYQMPCI